jgi:glycosyltransferase involved in cell wall biosynthesis
MNSGALASIIIPFYNRIEDTLKAISSALGQTYEHIEVIVVDDGSTNPINDHVILDDPRITLVKHPKNMGANAARNTGFKNSTGNWICFLDSDDTWVPNKLQIMIDALNNNLDHSIGYCGINHVLNGDIIGKNLPTQSGNIYDQLLSSNIVGSTSVPVISRKVMNRIGGFDETLKSAQDWDLWIRIAEKDFLFLAIPSVLVNYSVPTNANHISHSLNPFWNGRMQFLKKHKHRYKGIHKSALGQVYSDMGFLLIHRFNDRTKAFKCFIHSLKNNPSRLKSWRGLIATLIPSSLLYLLTSKEV